MIQKVIPWNSVYGTNDKVPHLGQGAYTFSAWIQLNHFSQPQMLFGQEF